MIYVWDQSIGVRFGLLDIDISMSFCYCREAAEASMLTWGSSTPCFFFLQYR